MKRWQRRVLIVLLLTAAFMLGSEVQEQLGLSFSLEGLADFQDWVANLGWLGPAVYVLLVIFRLFIGLSSHLVLILGGLAFGAVGGIIWGTLGLVLSALVLYFAASLLGDDWVQRRLEGKGGSMRRRIERYGATAVFVVSAHPVGLLTPLNLAAGLVRLPIWQFVLAVTLASPFRAGVYAILGTAVLELTFQQSLAIGGGLLAVIFVPMLIPSVREWVQGSEIDDEIEK